MTIIEISDTKELLNFKWDHNFLDSFFKNNPEKKKHLIERKFVCESKLDRWSEIYSKKEKGSPGSERDMLNFVFHLNIDPFLVYDVNYRNWGLYLYCLDNNTSIINDLKFGQIHKNLTFLKKYITPSKTYPSKEIKIEWIKSKIGSYYDNIDLLEKQLNMLDELDLNEPLGLNDEISSYNISHFINRIANKDTSLDKIFLDLIYIHDGRVYNLSPYNKEKFFIETSSFKDGQLIHLAYNKNKPLKTNKKGNSFKLLSFWQQYKFVYIKTVKNMIHFLNHEDDWIDPKSVKSKFKHLIKEGESVKNFKLRLEQEFYIVLMINILGKLEYQFVQAKNNKLSFTIDNSIQGDNISIKAWSLKEFNIEFI